MKKKILLIVSLLLAACLLSGCAMLSLNQMESMFRAESASQPVNSGTAISTSGDTVTISREEYDRLAQFSELAELMDYATESFYIEPDTDKMLEYAAKGLMNGLDDPYSYYYSPTEYAEMWEEDEGKYVGIGVLISSNYTTQICTIIRVFEGSPAQEVGVQKGDILYRVGEDLYVNADNLQDAVDIMRGIEGTDVDVTFIRNGEEITFTITRREVNVNQVESKMLDNQIGYVTLYQFDTGCDKEFEDAVNKLISDGAKGLVIDLRDNPGGWVTAAQHIADLFLDEGELCYLVYRDGSEEHEYPTYNGKIDIPLVVLMNENSASASEILAGALRDCADATVVGTVSYGKGIVQAVAGVGSNGAGFQLTIASYRTPKGTEVHKIGIIPDVEVLLPEGDTGDYDFADTENDPQLKKAIEVMMEKMQ